MELVVVHWQGRLALVTVVASLYMAEVGLLAGLELVVRLVLVLVYVLQEVRSQGRREWMRKIGVDHNTVNTVLGENGIPDLPNDRKHSKGHTLQTITPCIYPNRIYSNY